MLGRRGLMIRGLVVVSAVSIAYGQGKASGAYRPSTPAAIPASVLTSMPVRELAVFKDGHAFVLHESELPTDAEGHVVLDTLPTPLIGTFWPYSADPAAKLTAVVAGQREVITDRPAGSLRQMMEANPGAEVLVSELDGAPYKATILAVPGPKPEPRSEGMYGQGGTPSGNPAGEIVLLRVPEGTRAVPLHRIRDLTFCGETAQTIAQRDARHLMTLKLAWPDGQRHDTARVGMVYVQQGLRWIPNYRVDIDGKGQARIKLQATLVNELLDFEDATVHLVIGVPSFEFAEMLDPIALQEVAARMAEQMGQSQRVQRMNYAFSNALQTQVAAGVWRQEPAQDDDDEHLETAYAGASRNEDLFIFTIEHVSLRKGERLVVPIAEFDLTYEDVFVLDVPFAPPPEIEAQRYEDQRARELRRRLRAPQVRHHIRLANSSSYPLTTAPTLVLQAGQLISQSLMTYTPIGGRSDLELTTAVDVPVAKSDQETQRNPNAMQWNNNTYGRTDLAGHIQLRNRRSGRIRVEVVRQVLGAVDSASHDAAVVPANSLEDSQAWATGAVPYWWYRYDWPDWWTRFNGIGRITWQFNLEPGASIDLAYTWHYFWR